MLMTHNEYNEYVKKCVSKLYDKNDSYSYSDYKKLDEDIEIVPFDLMQFKQLSGDDIKAINLLFDEETIDRKGNYLLKGFRLSGSSQLDMASFDLKYGDYSNGDLSMWAYNKDKMLLYTYCEGDTTLQIFGDKTMFDNEFDETRNWYKEHYGHEEPETDPPQTPPKALSDIVELISKRFVINGSCDGMYISNVIAYENGLGDGESHFNGKTEIANAERTAQRLQAVYGCNIEKDDVDELVKILSTGKLTNDEMINGLMKFIKWKNKEKSECKDEWRRDYLAKEASLAKQTIDEIKESAA